MSIPRKLFAATLALTGFLLFGAPAKAQVYSFSGATVAPTNAVVNTPIEYTITVTNLDGFQHNNVYVTNALSGLMVTNGASMVNSASNLLAGEIVTNSVSVVFRINNFIGGDVARLTLNLTPLSAGPLTNQVTVTFFGSTTNATTNVVATITPPSTDLAVGMTNQASGVLVNDETVIGLSVTNLGPITAPGVVLTNTLPASFKFLSLSPTNSYTYDGGNLVLSLGTLTNGAIRRFQIAVQPTNAGSFDLTASVSTTNVLESNLTNNTVTTNMIVSTNSGNLEVVVLSQNFNLQTGLLELRVRVTNTNATQVDAARVIASGLTNGSRLYNASGTNSGNAYVHYNSAIAPGSFADLVLEYYVLKVSTFTNTLSAFGVPPINLAAPTNSGVVITNKAYSSGGFLIEFPATIGKTYTILYSDNFSFSNALVAQPSIVAPATQVQWIDNGPPKTASHPTNTTSRFYKVFQAQ